MSTASPAKLITVDEFLNLDIDVPVELCRGQLVFPYGEDGMVRPGPGRGGICNNIGGELHNWAKRTRLGRVASNDSWVTTSAEEHSVRGPDVGYYRKEKLPGGKLPAAGTLIVPDLCVEVRSPSNSRRELNEKKDEYLACGVEEVWLVYPETSIVEVHRQDSVREYTLADTLVSAVLPEFQCPLSEVFDGT